MNCVLKLKTKALQFHVANTSSTSMSRDCCGAGDEYVSVVFTQCTICIVITNTVTWWAQSVAGWAGADTTCAQGQGSPPYKLVFSPSQSSSQGEAVTAVVTLVRKVVVVLLCCWRRIRRLKQGVKLSCGDKHKFLARPRPRPSVQSCVMSVLELGQLTAQHNWYLDKVASSPRGPFHNVISARYQYQQHWQRIVWWS